MTCGYWYLPKMLSSNPELALDLDPDGATEHGSVHTLVCGHCVVLHCTNIFIHIEVFALDRKKIPR